MKGGAGGVREKEGRRRREVRKEEQMERKRKHQIQFISSVCMCFCIHACVCVHVHVCACMCACMCTHNLLPAGEDGDHALELLDVVLHVNTMEGQVAPVFITRVLQHSRHTRVGCEIGGQ